MSALRQSQKTPFTPAFVGGVVFFLCAVALVIWFGVKVSQWAAHQQTAPIKQVKLYGDFGHIKPQTLHSKLQQHLVGNYFKLDVDEVAAFLQQQPWVHQVAVRKQWPGTLVVVVTEHSPVAIWNKEYLLNKRGEVFRAPLEQLQATLPKLNGPEGAEQDALSMYGKVQALLALHQFEAQGLSVTERFAWEVQLSNGIALKLGREDTLKRVQRFIDLYPVVVKHKPEAIVQVDLRYDTGLAVQYAPPVITEKRKSMTKSLDRDLIVGLDIGTSQIKAVVGEITADNQLAIVGVGTHIARGMDKGGVNDLNLVVQSVQRAIDEAELMADCRVSSVYLGITGKHIRCQNESGMVPINDTEVTADDVANVIHAAKSVPISAERRLLHVLPQEFSVDMQEGIKSPIGMSGVRMEAKAHIITCANDMAKNIEKCVERCSLHVDQLIFSSLASSFAILTEDEKELGVCVVDMGGGTIDISIYTNGALRHTAVIPVAGNQVTSDIAKIFRTPIGHAEEIKIQYACALRSMVGKEESIEVPSVGGRPARSMSRHTLAEVVEPRYQELFELVVEEIRASGLEEQIAAGVVLTGGTAKMEGAVEFAEDIFQMPVRLGYPAHITGLTEYVNDPAYASVVGLLLYGKDARAQQKKAVAARESVGGFVKKLTSWFKGEF